MTTIEYQLIFASLLHDIGKLCPEEGTTESKTIDFIHKKTRFLSKEDCFPILEEKQSLGHLVAFGKEVASMVDDRAQQGEEKQAYSLYSIFNLLNQNTDSFHYGKVALGSEEIPYPTPENTPYPQEYYQESLSNIEKILDKQEETPVFLGNLLECLESNLSFLPSQTITNEVADISLYDHVKITSAVSSSLWHYAQEEHITDYAKAFIVEKEIYYDKDLFLLCSMDISGIQSFIYTIATSKALKNLRSRSFYLELVMEHMVDELLDRLSLCRSNLLYCGGGHAYLLLPHTKQAKNILKTFRADCNQWFLEEFSASLFVACDAIPCSAYDLQNKKEGSYEGIFRGLSNLLSTQKSARYTGEELRFLNRTTHENGERECSVCHSSQSLNSENKCPICQGLEDFSTDIQSKDYFIVQKEKGTLPLPFGYFLLASDEKKMESVVTQASYHRSYCKNKMESPYSTKIWVGDYQHPHCQTLEDLAKQATGTKKLAVLRGDIDNLGQAFTSGFQRESPEEYVVSLSRTATLSRKLSIFFKHHINTILENSDFSLWDKEKGSPRAVSIVYSGGDDVFFIGAWDEVIGAAVDLQQALEKFTQGTLTLSAGLGFYPKSYPLKIMARETGDLEECSKSYEHPQYGTKNAITLFDEEHCYNWKEFQDEVIGEKYQAIYAFFEENQEHGKAFLYKLLDFMRHTEDKINLARFAYLLARLTPKKTTENQGYFPTLLENYEHFSRKMYQWLKDDKHRAQGITALYLYVYLTRDEKKDEKKKEETP